MTAGSKDLKMRSPGHGGTSATGDGAVMGAVPDPFRPLRERSVSQEVWEARGYVPYYGKHHPLHNPDTIRAILDHFTMSGGQRDTLMSFVRNARNIKPPNDTFLRFRGDPYVNPKTLDKCGKDEGDGYGEGLLMLKYAVPGEPLVLPQLRPQFSVRTGGTMWHHHDRDFADDPVGLAKHINEEHAGHGEFPADKVHEHSEYAKYLLTPVEKETVYHDHLEDPTFRGAKGAAKLRAHLRRHHRNGEPREGRHPMRRPVKGQSVANRIDVHPWALARLPSAGRIYFAIEGTPKNDAILTRIIDTDAAATVFNVPSVTLWNAPELKRTAKKHWLDKLVVIIPDNDWHTNPKVIRQALLCREYLRNKCGVAACVAAPPLTSDKKLGIDDYLAEGGELDDLQVLDRNAEFSLALHAEEDGTIAGSLWTLGEIIGCRHAAEDIVQALNNHISRGLLHADRDLVIERDDYADCLEWSTGQRPVFTIPEKHRHTQTFVRLGDYAPPSMPQSILDVFAEELDKVYVPDMLAHKMVFPSDAHIAIAVKATAARCEVSERTVRTAIKEKRDAQDLTFEVFVHLYPRLEPPWSNQQIADFFGKSVRTVERELKKPTPTGLHAWLASSATQRKPGEDGEHQPVPGVADRDSLSPMRHTTHGTT